jgi:hypothetical protein
LQPHNALAGAIANVAWRKVAVSKRLGRTAFGLGVLVAFALVAAVPTAAVQPTRTRFPVRLVGHVPAGDGCTFDVTYTQTPGSRATVTDFSDGRHVTQVHEMHRTITNDATGATFADNQQYNDVEWIDPTTGLLMGITHGQAISQFYPGDIGPYGVVTQPVAYQVYGTQWWSWDLVAGHQMSFKWTGTLTDICAAIS